MNKIKYISAIALLFIVFASCTDDFLDVDPVGKVDSEAYYNTDEEVSLALIAAYDMLHSDQLQGWSSPFFIKQLPGDDSNAGGGGASDQPQYQALDDFDWSPENAAVKAFYQINYYGIYRCNMIINNATPDTDLKNRMIAEAKFLRAYYYSELTMVFGGVPLRLEAAKTLTEGIPRASKDEVYTQIEKDLTEAIAVLPNKSEYSAADKFRASKQAARALLGKVYVYQKDWPNAVTALASVIADEGSEVGLEANYSDVFRESTEFGMESLLEASFVSEGKNWGNSNWDRNADDNRHIILSGPRDYSDANNLLGIGLLGGWGFNPPTRKIYDAFESNDPRREASVFDYDAAYKVIADSLQLALETQASDYGITFNDYLKDTFEIDAATVDAGDIDVTMVAAVSKILGLSYAAHAHDQEGVIRMKYTTYPGETSTADGHTPELNYGTNWRLIRYADVLLLAAEAYHMNGNDPAALTELNKVRARAGVSELNVTGDDLFNAIVHEREVELAFEGTRFWDLVRWGLADDELSDLGFQAGKHELFPIPLDEINNNPDFGSQNPGY